MYIKNNPHLRKASGKARAPEQRVDRLSYSVRFTLKTGRKVADAGMSAYDPLQTLGLNGHTLCQHLEFRSQRAYGRKWSCWPKSASSKDWQRSLRLMLSVIRV